MKKIQVLSFIFLCFCSFSLIAQPGTKAIEKYLKSNDLKADISPDNIYYHIEKHGDGNKPVVGDYVMINYKGMLLDGSVFDESDPKDPFVFQLGYRQVIMGWEKGIPLFDVGSKGSLYIPSEMAYGSHGAGTAVPPNTPLIFEVEVLEIMDQKRYDNYMIKLEQAERLAYEQHMKDQFKKDKKRIQEFALSHKLKTKRFDSGLSYIITKKGKGEKAKVGNKVTVHYEGYLEDDRMFDSSYEKKVPFEFVLGQGKVINGWEEGLVHFNKGAEGWLLIPSKLAYGPRSIKEGEIDIPADACLFFKIKVEAIE